MAVGLAITHASSNKGKGRGGATQRKGMSENSRVTRGEEHPAKW